MYITNVLISACSNVLVLLSLPPTQGFHVYKVMDGLPAMKSGVILVGDQLLEVGRMKP